MAVDAKIGIYPDRKRCLITAIRSAVITAAIPRKWGRGIKPPILVALGKVFQICTGLNAILEGGLGSARMIARGGKAPIRSSREHGALAFSAFTGPPIERPRRVRNRRSRFRRDGCHDAFAGNSPLAQATLRMAADGEFKTVPISGIDGQEIDLQRFVVADAGAMAENITPRAAFGANAVMMLVTSGGHFVRPNPCADVGRIVRPFMARRPTARALDDVSAQDMRLNSHRISSLFSSARFSSSGFGGVNLRPVRRSHDSSSTVPSSRNLAS